MASSRQIEHTAAAWLARRDAGGWSARDQIELNAWLSAAIGHRVAFIRLEAAWRESDRLKALGAGMCAGTVPPRGRLMQFPFFTRRDGHIGPSSRQADPDPRHAPASLRRPGPVDAGTLVFAPRQQLRKPRPLGFAVAAMAVLLVVSLAVGWRYYPPVQPVAYRTAVGDLESMPLADGSQATLSSDSRILVALSHRERHVDLQQGEAFFHVAKDSGRPFVVAAEGRRVIAVGTRFSVRRDEQGVRVVVTEGVVRLESNPGTDGRRQPTTLLPAGSVAQTSVGGILVRSGTVEQAEQQLSWRDGFLSFHDTPLATAAAEFNRYNVRKLVIGDSAIAAIPVGGNFRWSNTDAFVRLLEQGFAVRAERHGDTVVLHSQ